MRKMIGGLAIAFVAAFAIGMAMPKVEAAPCHNKCVCGVPMKCCTINGVETCKPTTGFFCPQVYPC
jgi:hypothetical protein